MISVGIVAVLVLLALPVVNFVKDRSLRSALENDRRVVAPFLPVAAPSACDHAVPEGLLSPAIPVLAWDVSKNGWNENLAGEIDNGSTYDYRSGDRAYLTLVTVTYSNVGSYVKSPGIPGQKQVFGDAYAGAAFACVVEMPEGKVLGSVVSSTDQPAEYSSSDAYGDPFPSLGRAWRVAEGDR